MRKLRFCFLAICFVLFSAFSGVEAHECGPKNITVKVGENKAWTITNDEPQALTTYTIKSMGDTTIVRINPNQPFNSNGDGDYTFAGKKVGQTTFVIEWKAVFMGITIGQDDCEVTVTVQPGLLQQPDIEVKPDSLNFGSPVRVGASGKMNFLVSNTGNATLIVNDISSDNTDFFAGPASFSVAAGGSQLVEVVFEPAKLDTTKGTLTVVSNDPDESEVLVQVEGVGGEPDIKILSPTNPEPITIFGTSKGGFRLINDGNVDLLVSNITSSNPAFTIEVEFPENATFPHIVTSKLQSNFMDIDFVFMPTTVGKDSAMITITSDDPDESEIVLNVKSTGLAKQPDIDAKPTSVLFLQSVRVGESAKMSFQVFNVGDTTLIVTDIASNNNAFFAGPKSFSVVPGDSQLVDVIFEPIACGDALGTLTISSNDPDEPQFFVEVVGGGLTPDISADVIMNPPSTIVGQKALLFGRVDVSNSGCENLTINNVTTSNPAFPIQVGPPGTSLPIQVLFPPSNNFVTISVDFAPTKPGADSTTITVTSDDPDEPTVSLKVFSLGMDSASISLSLNSIEENAKVNDTKDIELEITNSAGQNAANLDWDAGTGANLFQRMSSFSVGFLELLEPTSGSILPGESDTLTVRLNGLDVADTTYTAEIEIATNIPGDDSLLVIPVTLTVQDSNPTSIETSDSVPEAFSISENYPNPFNPSTTIEYQVPVVSDIKLLIYNMLGQKVRTLVDQQNQPGSYSVTWDGRNDFGRTVAGGVYLFHFTAGDFKKVQKMILLK